MSMSARLCGRRLLIERFLAFANEGDVDTLIDETEEAVADAVELFSFTRVLTRDYDHGDRVKIRDQRK